MQTRPSLTPRAALLGSVLLSALTLSFLATTTSSFAQRVTPTYYTDVQPILEKNCISCHVAGGIAPFALDSGAAAVQRATDIARVVESGSMPPWPPGSDSPAFLNDKRLGTASKDILKDWARAGAPLGKPSAGQKP
jgi:mono/diheme cytochrome c family protein